MLDSNISPTDLETIKTKNYRLIFCIGLPGCEKESQIEKVKNEFKYSSLCMKNIIEKEISSDTDIGKKINEFKSKIEPIPSEFLVSLLIKNIVNCESQTVLIDGFPNRLEDALYFEQNIMPIELILKFNGSEETCLNNLMEAGNDTNLEELRKIFETMTNDLNKKSNFF